MTVSIDLPPHAESMLRKAFGTDLDRTAFESLILEGYRSRKLNFYQVQQLLGFDNRWDTEEWLGARGATMQYSAEDLETDRRNLEKIFGQGSM